jgi:hypothetical protein
VPRSTFDNSNRSVQLSTDSTWTGMTARRYTRYVGACPSECGDRATMCLVMLIRSQYYRRVCIPRFDYQAPNIDGKPVRNVLIVLVMSDSLVKSAPLHTADRMS